VKIARSLSFIDLRGKREGIFIHTTGSDLESLSRHASHRASCSGVECALCLGPRSVPGKGIAVEFAMKTGRPVEKSVLNNKLTRSEQ
jgi:hypothetical protein